MPPSLRSPVVVILLVGVVALLVVGVAQPGRAKAEPPDGANPTVTVKGARYQIFGIASNEGHLVAVDNETGRCWSMSLTRTGQGWTTLGTPIPAPK